MCFLLKGGPFMARAKELTPEEKAEHAKVMHIVRQKCQYVLSLSVDYDGYRDAQKVYPGDVEKMAQYIYDKQYKDKDTIEYVEAHITNLIEFMYFVAKLAGVEYGDVGQFRALLDEKYGRDAKKWAEYIKAHKNEIVKKEQKTTGTPATTQKAAPAPVQKAAPAPRPAFTSTGNPDLDGLLILRANMSCVMGYAKSKAENIRKNNDAMNKLYAENNKDSKEYNQYKADIEKYTRYIELDEKGAVEYEQKAKTLHFRKKAQTLKVAENCRKNAEEYKRRLHTTQVMFDVYCRNNSKKWGKNNKAIATYQELIKKDYDDIQKAYRDFDNQTFCIIKQDYQYLDYLIYLFYSHRAATLKEALNELDSMLRHNELMNAINKMSNQIAQSMNNLARQIESATASINANISYVNSNISYLNDNVTYLRQEVSQARDDIVSEQIETQSLIKEGNRIASMNYAATRDAVSSIDQIKTRMYY